MILVYKLLLFLLMQLFWVRLIAVQLDEETAMHMVFELKHGVNRAVHAGAMQLDENQLSQGLMEIDPVQARKVALSVLSDNLRLDENLQPTANIYLRSSVKLLEFKVINHDMQFPYIYRNQQLHYEVVLHQPGVIMIIEVSYPRMFSLIKPVTWTIKGTSEIVLD